MSDLQSLEHPTLKVGKLIITIVKYVSTCKMHCVRNAFICVPTRIKLTIYDELNKYVLFYAPNVHFHHRLKFLTNRIFNF